METVFCNNVTMKRGFQRPPRGLWPRCGAARVSFHGNSSTKDGLHRVWGSFAYILFPTFWVSTKEISCAADSGWRELDPDRVAELEAVVFEGNFGNTSLAAPSLIAENDKIRISREDGRLQLYNGKHWIQCLKNVQEQLGDIVDLEAQVWYTNELKEVFSVGLRVDVFEFIEPYDALHHQTVQSFAHETDQNKLYNTSILQKAKLVKAYFEREGRNWHRVQQALVASLGESKRSTINRWVVIGRDLAPEVLAHIGKHKDIAQQFVVGNKFLVGAGESARFKLSNKWAKVAFDWYLQKRAAKKNISSDEFANEYCLPAKHMETWERAQVKIYGVAATGFAAFSRVVERMQSEQARRRVLVWVNDSELRKQPHLGLDELKVVVEEMQKMKAGTNNSDPMAGAPLASSGSDTKEDCPEESGGLKGAPPASSDEEEMFAGDIPDDQGPGQVDPVMAKARSMAEAPSYFYS